MIKRLPPHISNQIAAGEVIERPAAVVKELLENAIDAGATDISITIAEAGKGLISIVDNGCGIAKDDLALLFERHATSKIATLEDIYAIDTLGFRGEALASIAAVARVEVISRTVDSVTGYQIQAIGGKITPAQPTATNIGTTITVRDLFYNTPVRYKFLASDRTESAAITQVVEKIMLAHPSIRFSYRLDGKVIRLSDGDNQLKHVIHSLYGNDFVNNMLVVSAEQGDISVHGYTSKPEYTRGNRRFQSLFVNRRYVECPEIQTAVNDCYKTLNTIHRFPVFILHINLPANQFDVNIHPAKSEIKFHDIERVKQVISSSIKQCLADNCLVPEVKLANDDLTDQEINEDQKINDYFQRFNKKLLEPEIYAVDQAMPPMASDTTDSYAPITDSYKPSIKAEQISLETIDQFHQPDDTDQLFVDDDTDFNEQTNLDNSVIKRATHYDRLQVVGVLFNTYIICQRDNSAFLIDQHAAHERVLFEQFLADFRQSQIEAQYLLEPFIYQSDQQTSNCIEQMVNDIKRMGIDIEYFGESSWLIRSVPSIKGVPFSEQSIRLILDAIDINKYDAITEHNLENIILASCKAAVKAHDKLSNAEIYALFELLRTYNQPYTCPHGRPIIIELTEYELEKLFKRIQ